MAMGKRHQKLTLEEREKIAVLKASGKSLREIARLLGRHRASLSRELQRNKSRIFRSRSYWPAQAQMKAEKRKSKASRKLRLRNLEIRNYVVRKLKIFWSPELIAGRISSNPYHSWEKGSVENSIGLVRRFLPKKQTSKKCLNYQTPKEVFKTLSGAIAG